MGLNSADRSGGESIDADKELDQKIEAKKKELAELKQAKPVDQAADDIRALRDQLTDLQRKERLW